MLFIEQGKLHLYSVELLWNVTQNKVSQSEIRQVCEHYRVGFYTVHGTRVWGMPFNVTIKLHKVTSSLNIILHADSFGAICDQKGFEHEADYFSIATSRISILITILITL